MANAPSDRGEYAAFECDDISRQDEPTRPGTPPRDDSLQQDKPVRPGTSQHSDSKSRTKSWRGPLTILISLAFGLGVALAHHLMGETLSGRPVADVALSQAWVSRFSTALAFLVKMAFAISVGTAYVQHQWLRIHQRPFRLSDVDAFASVLGNVFSFMSSTVWMRHPVLALMALVSWGIPLAAIIAPGSLTVAPARNLETLSLQVPRLSFNRTNYGQLHWSSGSSISDLTGTGRIDRLAFGTVTTREPFPLDSEHQNETYHLDFDGPAIKCDSANSSVIQNMTIMDPQKTGIAQTFLSWVPGPKPDTQGRPATLDYWSEDVARIFVMGRPSPKTAIPDKLEVAECILYNASYSVDFDFRYPRQTRRVSILSWNHPVNTLLKRDPYPFQPFDENPLVDSIISYLAVMNAFGTMLVGSASADQYGFEVTQYTSYRMLDLDWSRGPATQRGLEQVFQNITLSLLSDKGLIKNASLANAVDAEVETWPVAYQYDKSNLLLAYGIAFACAFSCSIVGMYAFFSNSASYQNLPSTYLRAMNNGEIRAQAGDNDTGADPLPKNIARSHVVLSAYGHTDRTGSRAPQLSEDVELLRVQYDKPSTTHGHAPSHRADVTTPHDSAAALEGEESVDTASIGQPSPMPSEQDENVPMTSDGHGLGQTQPRRTESEGHP